MIPQNNGEYQHLLLSNTGSANFSAPLSITFCMNATKCCFFTGYFFKLLSVIACFKAFGLFMGCFGILGKNERGLSKISCEIPHYTDPLTWWTVPPSLLDLSSDGICTVLLPGIIGVVFARILANSSDFFRIFILIRFIGVHNAQCLRDSVRRVICSRRPSTIIAPVLTVGLLLVHVIWVCPT